jgi:hypothetical protein
MHNACVSAINIIPKPELIAEQIRARQEEIRTLRKLLRAAEAARKGDEASKRLETALGGPRGGLVHGP